MTCLFSICCGICNPNLAKLCPTDCRVVGAEWTYWLDSHWWTTRLHSLQDRFVSLVLFSVFFSRP